MRDENNELIAVKANKFVQDYKVKNLTTTEIRIINFLIANIDSPMYDEKFRKFRFDIKEFCQYVYPDKEPGFQYTRLPAVIRKLSDKSAWKQVPSTDNPGKMKTVLIRWIERPEFEEGYVTIELNPYLAPYLLKLDKGFIKSKFRYTALAQSKYTIPLYELLKSWEAVRDHKKRFEVMELREYMDALEKSKDNFAEFKRRALDIAVREINEITDLSVSYKEIRRGRKVTHIEFTILHKKAAEPVRTFQKIEDDKEEQIDLVDVFEVAEVAAEEDLSAGHSTDAAAELAQFKAVNNLIFETVPNIENKEQAVAYLKKLVPEELSDSQYRKLFDAAKDHIVPFSYNEMVKYIRHQIEFVEEKSYNNFFGYLIRAVDYNYAEK